MSTLSVSAPGRICLFGEHQDYLDLPVIAAAVNLRLHISGTRRSDRRFVIDLPDIGQRETIQLPNGINPLAYRSSRDYFRSVINVLHKSGLSIQHGYDCTVSSEIPINAGTSSSSALTVAWTLFLLRAAGQSIPPVQLGQLAWQAEVAEFAEPGGKMDHFSSAAGGICHMDFSSGDQLTPLIKPPGYIVLGDSQEPKDTMRILSQVKGGVLNACERMRGQHSDFDIKHASLTFVDSCRTLLDEHQHRLLRGAVENRELTRLALQCLADSGFSAEHLGDLLNRHHEVLRTKLQISTPKIECMLQAGLDAGALGGKITGSGGGGCMFVYTTSRVAEVASAIQKAGGRAWILKIAPGAGENKTTDTAI